MVIEIQTRTVIDENLWIIYRFASFISKVVNLESFVFFQNLPSWVKYKQAMIYNQFSKNAYTQWMMVFEGWTIIVINEDQWPLFNYSSRICGDIYL